MEIPRSKHELEYENHNAWLRMLAEQFGGTVPTATYWYNPVDICRVLQRFGSVNNLTSAILPNGGWFDLRGAALSNEPGLIELQLGGFTYLCKPHSLWFLGLGDEHNEEWSYFHLLVAELMPIRPGELSHSEYFQRLTQLSPGEYTRPELGEVPSDYEQYKLSATARAVTRWLKGSMPFTLKTGPYLQDKANHLGEHSSITPAQFRGVMELKRDAQRREKQGDT